MKGEEVKQLQHDLTRLGYWTKIDGDFGPKTHNSLVDFQHDNSLMNDGIYGPITAGVMNQRIAAIEVGNYPTPVSAGQTPWLDWLERNEGEKEIKGIKANPFIIDLFRYTSLKDHPLAQSDETAWCAACMCAALSKNGYQSPNSAAAASFDTYGEKSVLRRGAILTFPTNTGSHRHVTCFTGEEKNGLVECIGGNQGNKLKRSWYKKEDIEACRWPIKNQPTMEEVSALTSQSLKV